ncbi:unnamed protein product [Dicrocoelium dendriticum]|nr:unnamed protein product [Dicrocoelium dendriticum]
MRRVCTSTRLRELRTLLRSHQLQAYINPSEDEHFSEYVDASDKRNAFISGFSGSVSTVIVTLDKAALWTDGRYHLQASHELDQNWTLMKAGLPSTLTEANWLVENTSPDSRIGYDPRLIPFLKIKHYQDELTEAEFKTNPSEGDHQIPSRQLIAVTDANLIDLAWDATSKMPMEDCSRPPRPANPIFSIPTSFSGDSWQTKLQRVRDQMLMKGAGMLVVSALDEIAWLLNLRGNDIQYNPVFYAHLIITVPRIDIFLTNTAMVESRDILNAQFSEDSRSVCELTHFHVRGTILDFRSCASRTVSLAFFVRTFKKRHHSVGLISI